MSARKSIDDVGDVASGYDTARVRSDLDPREAQRRAVARTAARGNLAAILCDAWGVDLAHPERDDIALAWAAAEFRDLADALGLGDAPERAPGTCRCGALLPMTLASPSIKEYKHGMCWACSHGAAAPTRQPAPAPPARHDRPYRGGQGHCPHCQRDYMLDGAGRLRPHPAWETRPGGRRVRCAYDCYGSGGYYPGEGPP